MEEIQELQNRVINKSIKLKIQNRARNRTNKIFFILMVTIFLSMLIFIIVLALENRTLKNKLSNNPSLSEGIITFNFFNQNISTKKLFTGIDESFENINKKNIHISYSLEDLKIVIKKISLFIIFYFRIISMFQILKFLNH